MLLVSTVQTDEELGILIIYRLSICVCLSQALLCVHTVVSQECAEQLLLAALEFLCSLGKIFIPPDRQVRKPDYHKSYLWFLMDDYSTSILSL